MEWPWKEQQNLKLNVMNYVIMGGPYSLKEPHSVPCAFDRQLHDLARRDEIVLVLCPSIPGTDCPFNGGICPMGVRGIDLKLSQEVHKDHLITTFILLGD